MEAEFAQYLEAVSTLEQSKIPREQLISEKAQVYQQLAELNRQIRQERKKLALCRERLLAAGFTDEEYARLHAPIGLAIGAQTPEEIAVSVAAEMIAVRAGLENGLRRPLG